MATRLKRRESGVTNLRRIFRSETQKAMEPIRRGVARGDAIHDARKRLKKARAALRLVRDAIDDHQYRRENVSLRDAARPLSEIRDVDVLVTTLETLVTGRSAMERRILRVMRKRLLTDRRSIRRRLSDDGALRTVRNQVRAVRKRANEWPSRGGWSVVGGGVERVYRAGHESYLAARREASDDNLHECRKQTKYLWHQLEFLDCISPNRMRRLQTQAHELADRLGDDHDLAVLRGKLEAARAALPNDTLRRLDPSIIARRTQLQREAFVLARRLYADPPSRFVERLGRWWHAWRAGGKPRAA